MSFREQLTILVCTCDNYEDLWFPFFKLLKTYWPDLDCQIILNTETKKYEFEGLNIECFQMGCSAYGQRMINHVDKINTPYTLLLLDDFFIRRPVNKEQIGNILSFMKVHGEVAVFQFNENEYCEDEKLLTSFSKIKQYAPYKLNMQAGIWRTDKLRSYWKPKDNPWIWEIFVNYTTFDKSDVFYGLDKYDNSPIFYGFNPDGMGVFRGKWVLSDVKTLFEKHGINIDYNKRGIYNPQKAVARLPVFKTMPYVFKRIPLRYALGFSIYEVWKRLLRSVGVKPKYLNFTVFLAEKFN